jgi:hypothetical protein
MWGKVLAACVGLTSIMIPIALQTPPEQAVSNAAKWLAYLGLKSLPSWLMAPMADSALTWAFIILGLLSFGVLIWPWPWRRQPAAAKGSSCETKLVPFREAAQYAYDELGLTEMLAAAAQRIDRSPSFPIRLHEAYLFQDAQRGLIRIFGREPPGSRVKAIALTEVEDNYLRNLTDDPPSLQNSPNCNGFHDLHVDSNELNAYIDRHKSRA